MLQLETLGLFHPPRSRYSFRGHETRYNVNVKLSKLKLEICTEMLCVKIKLDINNTNGFTNGCEN